MGCWSKYLETNEEDIGIRYLLGDLAYQQTNWRLALQCYAEISRVYPHNLELEIIIAFIYAEMGQFEESVRRLENIYEKHTDYDTLAFILGIVNHKNGFYEEAIKFYDRALILNGANEVYREFKRNAESELNEMKLSKDNLLRCKTCRFEINKKDKFCRSCGTKLI